MNGYVVFDEKIIDNVITDYIAGSPITDYYQLGVFNYVREIYDLDKPVYITNRRVRGVAHFIHNDIFLANEYSLILDFGFAKATILFTEDDHYRTTYTEQS